MNNPLNPAGTPAGTNISKIPTKLVQPVPAPAWVPPPFEMLYPQILPNGQPDPDSMHGIANEMWREGYTAAAASGKPFDYVGLRSAYLSLTDKDLQLCEYVSFASQPDPMGTRIMQNLGLSAISYRPGGAMYSLYQAVMGRLLPQAPVPVEDRIADLERRVSLLEIEK